jgi:hypothetical protein
VSDIYKRGAPFSGDEGYAQFIVNKELSKNGSMIDLVNAVQQYTLPNDIHFKLMNAFYPSTRRPGFKAFPWIWKGKQENKEEIELIAKYYKESTSNAETYYEILMQSDEGKEFVKWLRSIYGLDNK